MNECKYKELRRCVHDTEEDEIMRETCKPDQCKIFDSFYEGECMAKEYYGE